MKFEARYGYVGLAVEQKEFVAEGVNEKGLSAGLFYFPNYGSYETYAPAKKDSSIADLQLVSWILGSCTTVDEVQEAIAQVHVVAVDPRASTVHWRFADPSGRQVVLEIIDGKPRFYENKLGVLTNSPGFEWQLTNLNNYVNLFPGSAPTQQLGSTLLAPLRRRERIPGHPRRRDSSLALRAGSLLPGHSPASAIGRRSRAPVFPDTEQLRHPHRHRKCTRRKDIRAAQRDPMDIGHRPDKPCHLLPHDA